MDGFFKGLCDIRWSEGRTDRQQAACREEAIVPQVRPGPALGVAPMLEIPPSHSRPTLCVCVCVCVSVCVCVRARVRVCVQFIQFKLQYCLLVQKSSYFHIIESLFILFSLHLKCLCM